MAACGLQPLLEGAGLDCFVSRVLPRLSLSELAHLGATCRCLHTLLTADSAEAIWQASARHSLPHPQHPIHRVGSCQAYLRQQHAVHAAIETGGGHKHTITAEGQGALVPDAATAVAYRKDGAGGHWLVLRDLATGAETASFHLPDLASARRSRSLYWDPENRRCMVPWGKARRRTAEPIRRGFYLIDRQTGGVTRVEMGLQSRRLLCGGFSASGLLFIQHTAATGQVWTAYCAASLARHQLQVPLQMERSEKQELAVSPFGNHAALFLRPPDSRSEFLLWHLNSPGVQPICLPAEYEMVRDLVWGPCSSRLLCLTGKCALLVDTAGDLLASLSLDLCPDRGAWVGNLIAIKCRPTPGAEVQPDWLCLVTEHDNQLEQRTAIDLHSIAGKPDYWHVIGRPQIAPDWQHVALIATISINCRVGDSIMLRADGTLCLHCFGRQQGRRQTCCWSACGSTIASDRSLLDTSAIDLIRFQ